MGAAPTGDDGLFTTGDDVAGPPALVPLELFARISREVSADAGHGGTSVVLRRHDLGPDQWEAAVAYWTERIRTDTELARRFTGFFTAGTDGGGTGTAGGSQ